LSKIWDVQFTHGRHHIFDERINLNQARQNQNYSPLANAIINIVGDNKYREYLPFKGSDFLVRDEYLTLELYSPQLHGPDERQTSSE